MVDQYKAETDRLKAMSAALGPEAFIALMAQAVAQAMQTKMVSPMGEGIPNMSEPMMPVQPPQMMDAM